MSSEDVVKIYDLEIDEERFNRIQENLEKIDPSRNYSKKHTAKQGLRLLDKLLDDEIRDMNSDLEAVKRKLGDLEDALK